MVWSKLIISVGVCVAVFFVSDNKSPGTLTNIATVLASVSGTLMGFLVAALSILTSMADKRLIVNMNKTGHYSRLLRELYITAAGFLAVLIVSVITLFLSGLYLVIGVSLSAGLSVLAIQFFISTGWKFNKVIHYIGK